LWASSFISLQAGAISKTAVTQLKQHFVKDVKAVLLPELNVARL